MKQDDKESLIKLAKTIALFLIGFFGVIVSAKCITDGGAYTVFGVLNLLSLVVSEFALYKLLFKK